MVMSELGIAPEVDYIMPEVFPVGSAPVDPVLRPILDDVDETWAGFVERMTPVMEAEDPYTFHMIQALSRYYQDEKWSGFMAGNIVFHEILKKRAGDALPVVFPGFAGPYGQYQDNRMRYMSKRTSALREEQEVVDRTVRASSLRILDPDFYDAVEKSIAGESLSSLSATYIIEGISFGYFYYLEAFSDPSFVDPPDGERFPIGN